MSGTISPTAGPLWFFQYTNDGTMAYRLVTASTSLWFKPTSTYQPDELGGLPAETIILGVTGEPQSPKKLRGLFGEAQPRRVLSLRPARAHLARLPVGVRRQPVL